MTRTEKLLLVLAISGAVLLSESLNAQELANSRCWDLTLDAPNGPAHLIQCPRKFVTVRCPGGSLVEYFACRARDLPTVAHLIYRVAGVTQSLMLDGVAKNRRVFDAKAVACGGQRERVETFPTCEEIDDEE